MMPLKLRLEDRYRVLDEIRESLWKIEGEALTYHKIEQLNIDFHPVDINTGATSDSVTPYFLPRTSFPSCRDMRGNLKDAFLREGQSPRRSFQGRIIIKNVLSRFFPSCVRSAYHDYVCSMDVARERRIWSGKTAAYGWVYDGKDTWVRDRWMAAEGNPPHVWIRGRRHRTDVSAHQDLPRTDGDEGTLSGAHHYMDRKVTAEKRSINFLGKTIPSFQSLSHGIAEYEVEHCHKGLPSISEVLPAVIEIQHSMMAQMIRLQGRNPEQSSPTFNHILPRLVQLQDYYGGCRFLYAYFDGGRLKVQFTEVLEFTEFAVESPPGVAYIDHIDVSKYYDTMDKMLKWAWPIVQGDTSESQLII